MSIEGFAIKLYAKIFKIDTWKLLNKIIDQEIGIINERINSVEIDESIESSTFHEI